MVSMDSSTSACFHGNHVKSISLVAPGNPVNSVSFVVLGNHVKLLPLATTNFPSP